MDVPDKNEKLNCYKIKSKKSTKIKKKVSIPV